MSKQWSIFTLVLLASFLLSSCGREQSSDSATLTPISAVDAQKTGDCTSCHSIDVHTNVSGIAGVNKAADGSALAITHDCEDCHGGGQYHRGVGPIPYPAPDGSRCVTCHADQVNAVLATKHNAQEPDNAAMLATSHETNHCQRCHTAEGSRVFAPVIGNADVYAYNSVVNPAGRIGVGGEFEPLPSEDSSTNPLLHNPTCAACHNPLTKELVSIPGWNPNGNGVADQFDMCTSCHTLKLNDGTLLGSGLPLEDGAGRLTEEFYHNTSWYRTLLSTHRDNPDTGSVGDTDGNAGNGITDAASPIEGYVIREKSANPCFDCHGHNLLTNTNNLTRILRNTNGSGYAEDPAVEKTVYTEWAGSAHAGGLLKAKYAAQMTGNKHPDDATLVLRDARMTQLVSDAAVQDVHLGNAWVHYNWDRSGRAACQMCHTATGAANFMNGPATYDAANNNFDHLSGWTGNEANGSPQNEVLYCWACHSNAAEGALRAPGAITLAYQADGADITLPDMGNSNVCINCHSGRGNMDSLLGAATADPVGAAVTGGTKTHYFASGATIYQALTKIGYMYAGLSYTDKSYFAHDSLGCAECHMTGDTPTDQASHTFDVVEKDGTGTITAIDSEKCVECHDGEHALFVSDSQIGDTLNIWNGSAAVPTVVTQLMADDAAAEMEHEAHGYHNAIEVLGAVLTAAGTPPQAGYPYFSGTATDQGHGGAMHNWSYLHHEPGAYAHNRYYAKRLIFDSVDWLTNATNGSVDAAGSRTLDGVLYLDPATYGAAITWLGGDTITGIVSTRP